MSKIRIIKTFFFILFILILAEGFQVQAKVEINLVNEKVMDLIRKEKFDLILPQIMRNNKIDMWIHVMRAGDPDPLTDDFGTNSGVIVFTDRGSNRIERAVLGHCSESIVGSEAYDIFLAEEEEVEGKAGWEKVIGKFVAERDPQRIGVNFSEKYAVADGISHTDYLKLVKALGDKYAKRVISAENLIIEYLSSRVMSYAKRVISAENLIIEYLSSRVMSEVVIFTKLCEISAKKIEREFDKIEPGVTALKDVSGNIWVRDRDGFENNTMTISSREVTLLV